MTGKQLLPALGQNRILFLPQRHLHAAEMNSFGENEVLVLVLGVGCFQVLISTAVLRSLR